MPELDCKEDKTLCDQPYSICGALAVHAQKLIEQGEHRKLKDCLDLLATAYNNCNNLFKTAIENVFLYHVETQIILHQKRQELMCMLPPVFRNIMMKHMNAQLI